MLEVNLKFFTKMAKNDKEVQPCFAYNDELFWEKRLQNTRQKHQMRVVITFQSFCMHTFDPKCSSIFISFDWISVFCPSYREGISPRSLPKISLPFGGDVTLDPFQKIPPSGRRQEISPRFLPNNFPLWAGNWILTCSKHLSNFFLPAAGWKHNTILEMYINWNGLPRPLLGPQNCFRLRRAKSITRFHKMYVNWNDLTRPLLQPQEFFRLRQVEKIPRFQ